MSLTSSFSNEQKGHHRFLTFEGTRGEGSSLIESWRVLEPRARGHLVRVSVLGGVGKKHLDFSLFSLNCLSVPPIGKPNQEPAGREVKMAQSVGGGGLGGSSQRSEQRKGWRLALGLQTENEEYAILICADFIPSSFTSKCHVPDIVTVGISLALSYQYKHKFATWSSDPIFKYLPQKVENLYSHKTCTWYLEWLSSEFPQNWK